MLKDRLSPADEAAREKEMRESLSAFPRILDLVARGPLADPDAEAIVYLRSSLDPSPVIVSNDQLMGCIKAAENFFRAQGVGHERCGRDTAADLPRRHRRDLGRGRLRHRRTAQSAVHARGHHRPAQRGEGKTIAGAAAGHAGRALREDRRPATGRAVAATYRGRPARRHALRSTARFCSPIRHGATITANRRDASEAERVAVMLPTGGTTGHPEGRPSHQPRDGRLLASRRGMALDYRKGDRAMISLPLFHVGGLFVGVGACLSAGTTIVIPGPAGARDPALVQNFWNIIEKYRLTHAGNVPTTLGALADIPVGDCDISSLRVTPTGASICPPEIERRYLARWGGPCVQQVYGMTELAGAITHDVAGVKPRPESRRHSEPAGRTCHPRRRQTAYRAVALAGRRIAHPGSAGISRAMSSQKQTEDAFHRDGCAPVISAASTPMASSTSWAAPRT